MVLLPSRPWQAAQVPARVAPFWALPGLVFASSASASTDSSGRVSTGSASSSGATVVWAKATAPTAKAAKPARR